MIYVLDHFYAMNHLTFAEIVESDKEPLEVVELTSSLEFLFEECVDVSAVLDIICLKKIVCDFFGMKDVMNEYVKYLPSVLKKRRWNSCTQNISATDGVYMTHIDLYDARESCCGARYRIIMEKWLPKGKQLDGLKEVLLREGKEW